MYRAITLVLLPLSVFAREVVPLRRVARRLLGDTNSVDDFSCSLKGAFTESDCTGGDGGCVFCPMGSMGGVCVSSMQGMMIGMAGVPHLSCGPAAGSPEDAAFWDDFFGCGMASTTSNDCLDTPRCTWCEDTELKFGFCVSEEGLDGLLLAPPLEEDEEEAAYLRSTCSTTNRDSDTPGILDPSCAVLTAFGSGEDCTSSVDLFGNACVWMAVDGAGDICVTETQSVMPEDIFFAPAPNGINVGDLVRAFGVEEEEEKLDSLPDDIDESY